MAVFRRTWQFYTPIAANLIASENRKRFSPPIDTDTLPLQHCSWAPSRRFETSCDKIAQPDWLTLLVNRSGERRKSQERANLANAGEFNRRYLTY